MVRSRRFALSLVCIALLTLAIVPASAEEVVLSDVPAYDWTHGCSPTAGMMIMGYWDANGCPDLIPGANSWWSNQSAIKNAIASSEHVADYALYNDVNDENYSSPHMDKSELGGAHANNCLADFMRTSFSSEGLTYGSTSSNKIGPGMEAYASWRGYSFTAGGDYSSMPTWADFTKEIKFGRPVELGVDADGNGEVDHSVTAIGYRDTSGYREYAFRDTWSASSTPRWERFRTVSASYNWGVEGMNTLRTSGTTRDTMWTSASGNWQDPSWSTGLPDSSAYACITDNAGTTISADANAGYVMNRGIVDIQGGTFSVGTLASAGSITQSNGSVNASGTVAVSKNGLYALSGGTLHADSSITIVPGGTFEWTGGSIRTPLLIIGEDYDSFTADGFVSHCDFTIGSAGQIGSVKGKTLYVKNGITVTQTDGEIDMDEYLWVTDGGTYKLNGSGVLTAKSWIYVGIGGTGTFLQSGGTSSTRNLALGEYNNSKGTYQLSGGFLSAEDIMIGRQGEGTFIQTGGAVSVDQTLTIGERRADSAHYELSGGELSAGRVKVAWGYEGWGSTADFVQSGGTHTVSGTLYVGNPAGVTGTYELSDGGLTAAEERIGEEGTGNFLQSGGTNTVGYLVIGPTGRYELSGGKLQINSTWNLNGNFDFVNAAARVTVGEKLDFWANSTFAAAAGSTIHMTGSAFENESTNPDNLAGLANLTLIFEGGSEDVDPFEVAGEDMGPVMEGYDDNFALGTLQLGGDDIGQLQLVNLFDNQPDWTCSEALYVEKLILGAGSTLDLDGLNLYYLKFTDHGGNVTGGTPTQVPEPATMLLLAFGGLAMLKRRR